MLNQEVLLDAGQGADMEIIGWFIRVSMPDVTEHLSYRKKNQKYKGLNIEQCKEAVARLRAWTKKK